MKQPTKTQPPNPDTSPGRTVGLDVNPDSFAAAIFEGTDPLKARIVQSVTKQPLALLEAWAGKHTTVADLLIIEASSN